MKKIEVTINKIFMRSILMILVFLTLSFSCSNDLDKIIQHRLGKLDQIRF